jgi:CRP/FNR family transcriptional regulator
MHRNLDSSIRLHTVIGAVQHTTKEDAKIVTLGPAGRRRTLTDPLAARPRVVVVPDNSHLGAWYDLRGLDLREGLDPAALLELDAVFGNPVGVKKREVLYRAKAPFASLYVIRLGTFKTVMLAEDGREQIVGYQMLGDIVGFDGIGNGQHTCEAVALEDSEVCPLPFEKLDELAGREPTLRRNVYRLISRRLNREREMMVLLGGMSAEQRLAAFLLDLAERFRRAGYSASEFVLRMTRDEIASFLGLKLETVSRTFSRLHAEGLIQVQGRAVKLLDAAALRRAAGQSG